MQADFGVKSAKIARSYKVGPASTILNKFEAPWAGNYFPMMRGGLANRWRLRRTVQQTLDQAEDGSQLSAARVKERLRAMSAAELDLLSPAEKMDIYAGNYDFRITKHELTMRGPQRPLPPQDWEGFCNGMRAAGICQLEPTKPILMSNPDGIAVPFQPSDIKGLAGASYFYTEKYAAMGSPTMTAGIKNENPPNAGSFDVALRSYLGMERRAFVIDNHAGTEIWNVSVVGYDRKIVSEEPYDIVKEAAAGAGRRGKARKKIRINLDLDYLGEAGISESNRATTQRVANRDLTQQMHYKYELYVDENDRIIDGVWIGDAPDMAWFPGGRGTDASSGNPSSNQHLNFDQVEQLVRRSALRN